MAEYLKLEHALNKLAAVGCGPNWASEGPMYQTAGNLELIIPDEDMADRLAKLILEQVKTWEDRH